MKSHFLDESGAPADSAGEESGFGFYETMNLHQIVSDEFAFKIKYFVFKVRTRALLSSGKLL